MVIKEAIGAGWVPVVYGPGTLNLLQMRRRCKLTYLNDCSTTINYSLVYILCLEIPNTSSVPFHMKLMVN